MASRFVLRVGQTRTAADPGKITGVSGGALVPLPAGSTNIPSVSPEPLNEALPGNTVFGGGTGFASGFPVAYDATDKIIFEGAERMPQLGDGRNLVARVHVRTAADVLKATLLIGPGDRLPDGQRTVAVEGGKLIPLPEWSIVLIEG